MATLMPLLRALLKERQQELTILLIFNFKRSLEKLLKQWHDLALPQTLPQNFLFKCCRHLDVQ